MGADFLLAFTPAPDTSAEAIAKLHARVEDVADSNLIEIVGACLGDDEDGCPQAKALLHEAIDEIAGANRRDVGEFALDGITYVATGGMSWGDDPTDAFRYILALDYSMLTRPTNPPEAISGLRQAIARAINDARTATGRNPVLLEGTALVAYHVADLLADLAGDFDPGAFLIECGVAQRVRCRHCDEQIQQGFVDYSDTAGYVHSRSGEALCRPGVEDSPAAETTR